MLYWHHSVASLGTYPTTSDKSLSSPHGKWLEMVCWDMMRRGRWRWIHTHHLSDQYSFFGGKFRDMWDISHIFTSCSISCARFFAKGKNAGYYTKHDCQVSQPSNETVESSFPSSSVTLPRLVLFWPWNLSTAQAPGNFQHLWWSHEVFTRLVILRCQGSAVWLAARLMDAPPMCQASKILQENGKRPKQRAKHTTPTWENWECQWLTHALKIENIMKYPYLLTSFSHFPWHPMLSIPLGTNSEIRCFNFAKAFIGAKKKAPSPSLGLGSHTTLTAH